MNTGDISQIDKEIVSLERRLNSLHTQRVSILEQQVRESQDRLRALSSTPRRAAAAEAPSARSISTKADSPRVKPAPKGRRPKATTGAKKKRTRMPSDIVNQKILETVKAGGTDGLSQKEISVRSAVNYQTTAKKLRELAGIVKKGSGKEARYFLKG